MIAEVGKWTITREDTGKAQSETQKCLGLKAIYNSLLCMAYASKNWCLIRYSTQSGPLTIKILKRYVTHSFLNRRT